VFFRRTLTTIGTLLAIAILWFVAAVFWPLNRPVPNTVYEHVLISEVSIIDIETGEIKKNQSIRIKTGTIVGIGNDLPPDGAWQISANGNFAIPGMFDMHVHSTKMSPALMHPLFIAAGVTAVRDMGGCIGIEDDFVACADEKRAWNTAVSDGEMVGPRYDQITSLAINGGQEIPDQLSPELGASTVEGARHRVDYDKARGIDFLKPYSNLKRDEYFALAEAAKQNGMYLAGHKPIQVGGLEAIKAGQRSIEHAFLFIWECFPAIDDLRAKTSLSELFSNEIRFKMIADHDEERCSALHTAMIEANTAFVPTHTTRKLDAYALDETFRTDARLKYIPSPLRTMWLQDANNMAKHAGDGGQKSYQEFYQFGLTQTGVAHRAGVMVLAGTDAPDSFVFPGLSLHDELEHLVIAGLSPHDALKAATILPAAFLGLEGIAGVIAEGARADIVLLSKNPLKNISGTRSIETVVLAGVVYQKDDLEALSSGVGQAANHWSMWPKFMWQLINSPVMKKQFAD